MITLYFSVFALLLSIDSGSLSFLLFFLVLNLIYVLSRRLLSVSSKHIGSWGHLIYDDKSPGRDDQRLYHTSIINLNHQCKPEFF